MLEIRNLTKKFKNVTVVGDLSFQVKEGEIVGLLGENGAGKTTTLRMISTMLKVSSGEIKVNEFDATDEPDKVRSQIGILFGGEVGLYDRLTGRENIRYFANLFGMNDDEANRRIDELASEFGMIAYINKRVGKFSRGMKQKVSIARSIVQNPSVMLLDEPCTGLDVSATRIVHHFIKKCQSENKTILFSSHSMVEVEKLCDRVIIIHKGKLIENATVRELKEKYKNEDLEDVFVSLIGGEFN
ncbi:ATP-binding cassette domain-containing protein [Clostridium vincentii]|uniref:Putative ABC transporter ATP-binding protein YbhF n=1 Tax=Clostridium vincentii TaxID=52704 RepID=A0A2T0BDG9_9CLOT|nr:ATP-binding cassette domain-containing protein [Clostridium vincentii]PRR81939.1 putative ABC transporter ATP-binding protein YbhF [Clostridium vincentii]